jgi:hypothetical protein
LERIKMAMHLLSARQVHTATSGDHPDGGGLFLRSTPKGSSWVLRYTAPDGRRREMGLGTAERSTLAASGAAIVQARRDADRQRALLADGVDPISKRAGDRDAAKAATEAAKAGAKGEQATLARVARKYHEQVIEPRRTTKHSAQWIASLELNVPHVLWHRPIDKIEPPALLEVLAALQLRVQDTASRVRQRLEAVFDDAQFHKLCTTNPAAIVRRKLAERAVGRERQPA